MNALERNSAEFAHRGQRIWLGVPAGVQLQVGEPIGIKHPRFPNWTMPARVLTVDGARVELEPGAALAKPEEWHIPGAAVPAAASQQFDLFAGAFHG